MDSYKPTATYNLVYVYEIHDEAHKDMIKVGKASLSSTKSEVQLLPNCDELMQAAHKRIYDDQLRTAKIEDYAILYTELATRHFKLEDGTDYMDVFDDKDIHDVLKRSQYHPEVHKESGKDSEWFRSLPLETVIKAISAYKNGHLVIPTEKSATQEVKPAIKLRKEQAECVEKTRNIFAEEDTMLWDCKMRFGKTVTAYELIRQMGLKKVIVITHRPAVEDGWDEDHDKILGTENRFIDKTKEALDGYDSVIDSKNDSVLADFVNQNIPFTYFASIQDLRGSKRVGGKFNKNNGVFDIDWDLLIIDEAHEGTQTELGDAVINAIRKKHTKVLSLTGTAYGLLKDYGNNVFTWTYVDEQKAKKEWAELHPNEKNPYDDLPTMNILTFDLGDAIENSYRYVTENQAFNFHEFFRTWTGDINKDYYPVPKDKHIGDFVHEEAVWSFLNLITQENDKTNYPFSRQEYIDMFKHTFWLVPGVKEARALSALLKRHPVFSDYKIVNVAGDGDAEEQYDIALRKVKNAIKDNDKTITISCGRLTTGVTVKEWTGVMVLSGSANTSVNGYMQTIFRVQSPGVIEGKRKENCYVFDFAPDRALKVIGEVHKLSSKSGSGEEAQRIALGEFLNFCPVIAVEGTQMNEYDVPDLMRQIKRISVDAAINSGFDDDTIYLTDAGLDRNDLDREILRKLSDVVAPKKKGQREKSVLLANNGMTEEERRLADEAEKKERQNKKNKNKTPLTPEEKAALEKRKEEKKAQQKLFDLLRAVSIRLPLLFYGADADITEIIRLKDFVNIVDDESWEEFMPRGLKKKLFLDISKYYDEDVLVGAGLRIRKLAKAADDYPPTVRAAKIVEIISKFKNPDKETVLTPWRVVNMHLGDTIGGYNFFTDNYTKETDEPTLIEHENITADILCNDKAKILEINSKSGLYPLYMAYTLYMFRVNGREKDNDMESLKEIWNEVLSENIFVLCKTPMAKSITKRTLSGYTNAKTNIKYLPHLIDKWMKDIPRLSNKLKNPQTWDKEGDKMKFDAVVGNPPYNLSNENTSDTPIYHLFMDTAFQLSDKVTFITPARYLFNAGKTPKEWNDKILNDSHFKIVWYSSNSTNVFPTVDIKGGVAVMYRDAAENFGAIQVFTAFDELNSIIKKTICDCKERGTVSNIVYAPESYKLSDVLHKENPWANERLSEGHKYDITTNIFEKLPELFLDEKPQGKEYIGIYGRLNNDRIYKWIKKSYIQEHENLDFYKVLLPKSNGSGALGEVLSTPLIGEPLIGHTQTFLSMGKFNSYQEAEALLKYLKGKFSRVLLGVLKVTQDNKKAVWRYVPIQDFTEKSDIDWTQSVEDIDKQLYKKYGLTNEEIDFIETNVKSMSAED